MKMLKRGLLSLIVLMIALVITVYFVMRHSTPVMEGKFQLPGLSKEVQVTRDKAGIPHIFAKNRLDAFKALGYVVASDRLFQMEMHRRLLRGELSEIFGIRTLTSDRLSRSLTLKKSVDEMIAAKKANGTFNEQTWNELEAYYSGVNAYAHSHPLPYEFTLLGLHYSDFKPEDGYMMVGYMAYSFGVATKADLLFTRLSQKFPFEMVEELRNDRIPGRSPGTQVSWFDTLKELTPPDDGFALPYFEGSNAWLLSPARSQSRKSIFANDPHIGYTLPGIWYEAHIKTPDFELYGHHLPLIPFAVLGHNDHQAWGFTMSLSDDMDLYKEEISADEKTYTFKGQQLPLETWEERIKVKGLRDHVIQMKRTQHGPIMDDVLSQRNLALKWAYHSHNNDTMTALRKMGSANNMQEFKLSLHEATAPGLNVMYADPANIGWWIFGEVVKKKNPHSDFILDGASGNDEYEKVLSFEEKPHLENPASGVIITANSRPEDLPENIRGDFQSPDRKNSIASLLATQDTWNTEDLQKIQTANFNLQAQVLVKIMLDELKLTGFEQKTDAEALNAIRNWNFRSEIDSLGAAVYHQWNNEILALLLQDMTNDEKTTYIGLPHAWTFYETVMQNENSPWWKDQSRGDVITQGFKNTISSLTEQMGSDSSRWKWGRLHTIEYQHPLGKAEPLDLVFNLGPWPMPGAMNEINNNKPKALGVDFKASAGPSTRRLIDFAHPKKSYGILPLGNSGHKFSPFYKNQAEDFLAGRYRAQLMDEADINKEKTYEMTLIP